MRAAVMASSVLILWVLHVADMGDVEKAFALAAVGLAVFAAVCMTSREENDE